LGFLGLGIRLKTSDKLKSKTLNNKEVKMKKDKTVLELVKAAGVDVDDSHAPLGCHYPTWQQLRKTAAEYDKMGNVKKAPNAINCRANLAVILETDPEYGSLCYCEHSDRMLWKNRMIEPADLQQIALDLELNYRLKTKDADLRGAVLRVATQNKIEPIKEWLEALPAWDGAKRIANMFKDRWGVEVPTGADQFINEILPLRWMVSLVARIMDPGCHVHTVLILVGPKGMGKSMGLSALAGAKWFADSNINITNKSAYELIHQSLVWLWELAEMHALHGRSANNAKMFITSPADRYRPTWGQTPVHRKRRTVFVATTNDYQFLTDGPERRFWPLQVVAPIDVAWIEENRTQLFAEALHHYRAGVKWWLQNTEDCNEEQILEDIQQAYIVEDPWAITVAAKLRNDPSVTTDDLLEALHIPMEQRHTGHMRRIGQICRDLGYTNKQMGTGKRLWVTIPIKDAKGKKK
jgi:putative DNA primase/helicase